MTQDELNQKLVGTEGKDVLMYCELDNTYYSLNQYQEMAEYLEAFYPRNAKKFAKASKKVIWTWTWGLQRMSVFPYNMGLVRFNEKFIQEGAQNTERMP